jgi:hypothetical protein
MPLSGQQVVDLSSVMGDVMDVPALDLCADNLGIGLGRLSGATTPKDRARDLITHVLALIPPRDRELLEELTKHPSARLQTIANQLLTPTFTSPTGRALDAIALGPVAFVDRGDLRKALDPFVRSSDVTTRVLVVRGEQPCGKSYTWQFLRHMAKNSNVPATPIPLPLINTNYTPKQFLEQAFRSLGLEPGMPTTIDDPQEALIDPLIASFNNQVSRLERAYWLVIDDLNDPGVNPMVRETAYALASAVEKLRPERLWLVLLGFNSEITDPDLRNIAQEDARFPDTELLAAHFEAMAGVSPNPLPTAQAREIAAALLSAHPTLDKPAMIKLTPLVEGIGAKLLLGLHPTPQ